MLLQGNRAMPLQILIHTRATRYIGVHSGRTLHYYYLRNYL